MEYWFFRKIGSARLAVLVLQSSCRMLLTEALLIVHEHNKLSDSIGFIYSCKTIISSMNSCGLWTLKSRRKKLPTGFIYNDIKFKVWKRKIFYNTFIHIARIFESILVQPPLNWQITLYHDSFNWVLGIFVVNMASSVSGIFSTDCLDLSIMITQLVWEENCLAELLWVVARSATMLHSSTRLNFILAKLR